MSDVFDYIERSARAHFGESPVCVHVGDVDACEIKRHPNYDKFRDGAISAGLQSPTSSRVWESLIAMARLCDLEGGTTWRLVILDCIVPCFRSVSTKIARSFRVDRDEIRSAMVVAALEVWASTRVGVPPGQVRDRMVKAAFDAAYRSGNAAPSEYVSDEIEMFLRSDMGVLEPSLKATSILDVEKIRDPDVVEQIKGERFGALLQRVGCYDAVKEFHEDLRVGRRSGSVSQTVKSSLARFRISDPNLYHYMSDLYPPFVGIKEAADVMGVTLSAAHRLVRAGEFPFPVARAGNRYKVSVKALMHFMEIPDAAVHVDDVENGALHVRETRGDVRQGV